MIWVNNNHSQSRIPSAKSGTNVFRKLSPEQLQGRQWAGHGPGIGAPKARPMGGKLCTARLPLVRVQDLPQKTASTRSLVGASKLASRFCTANKKNTTLDQRRFFACLTSIKLVGTFIYPPNYTIWPIDPQEILRATGKQGQAGKKKVS